MTVWSVRVVVAIGVLFPLTVPAADDAIPADALAKLRNATVLVKVTDGDSMKTGSGFFLDSKERQGYVITNAHVTDAADAAGQQRRRISVVLAAGSMGEKELRANLICASTNNDIAILSVEGAELPAPLPLADAASLRETLPVCVLGFPFGKELALDKRHPAVTVSYATVSSLRRDSENQLSLIQLDGNLNPGNSGGPVVDRQGRLVGIAVARIENSGIGFAIPAQVLATLMAGEVSEMTIENSTGAPPGLYVQCKLLDPYNKISTVGVQVSRTKSRAGRASEWVHLERKAQEATGSVGTPRMPALLRHYVTVEVTRTDGTKVRKSSQPIELRDGKLQGKPSQVFSLLAPAKSAPALVSGNPQAVTSTPIQFGGDATCVAPAHDGSGLFFIQPKDGVTRLSFWNLEKNQVETEIGVPRAPSHVALIGDRLVVTCPESKVVAIIDPLTKKIATAVEVQTEENLLPAEIACSLGPDRAYVLCTPEGQKPKDHLAIVEIDLKAGKSKMLSKSAGERAAATQTHLVLQDNFGGSPMGMLSAVPLAELAPEPGRRSGGGRARHESCGPAYPTPAGLLVASNESDNTSAFTPDQKESQWTVGGVLLTSWPDASAFLLATGARNENTSQWPVKAVDAGGAVLWEHRIGLDKPVSLSVTQAIHFNNSRDFLIIGTARQGSSLDFALRNVTHGVSRTCVVSSKNGDYVVFAISRYSGEIVGRFAFKVKEESKQWYFAKLPTRTAATAGKAAPPSTLTVGDTLEFQPELPQGAGAYSLKSGPQGMTVDAKTGKIVWKTDASSLGKYDIEIIRTEDGVASSMLKFSVHVKSRPQ